MGDPESNQCPPTSRREILLTATCPLSVGLWSTYIDECMRLTFSLSFFLMLTMELLDKTWLNHPNVAWATCTRRQPGDETRLCRIWVQTQSHIISVATTDLPFLGALIDYLLRGHVTIR